MTDSKASFSFQINWPNWEEYGFQVHTLLSNKTETFLIGWDHNLNRWTQIGLRETGPEKDPTFYAYAVKQLDQGKYIEILQPGPIPTDLNPISGKREPALQSHFDEKGWISVPFPIINSSPRLLFWLQEKTVEVIYKVGPNEFLPTKFWEAFPHETSYMEDLRNPIL